MAYDNRLVDKCRVQFYVGKNDKYEIGSWLSKFEWVVQVNSGHRIYALFEDLYQNSLEKDMIEELLKQSRTDGGVDISVIIHQHYDMKRGKQTEKRKFKLLKLNSFIGGSLTRTTIEIVAIDKASWYLNRGKCKGKAYKGKVSSVINDVVSEYSDGVVVDVGETTDSDQNIWWDMKLDPKTFISSITEWSASITESKTPLIIHTQDDEFNCKEWSKLSPTKTNNKKFHVADKKGKIVEISDSCTIDVLSNNWLSPVSSKLLTGGISATTGLYIDKDNKELKEESYLVNDSNTSNKLNVKIKKDQSFKKPSGDESTFIQAVPEHNNMDVGLPYKDYAIGRARNWYQKIIYTSLRVKLTIDPGDTDFDNIKACGRDKIILEVIGFDKKPYYLNGPWLLYGFRHLIDSEFWQTELFLSRLDYDAEVNKI